MLPVKKIKHHHISLVHFTVDEEGSYTTLIYFHAGYFNLLAPEFGIQILAHPVCKM